MSNSSPEQFSLEQQIARQYLNSLKIPDPVVVNFNLESADQIGRKLIEGDIGDEATAVQNYLLMKGWLKETDIDAFNLHNFYLAIGEMINLVAE